MNSSEVFYHLDVIASHSGKKDKERLVSEGLRSPTFERVLKQAYDPLISFGIAETSLAEAHELCKGIDEPLELRDFNDETWELLDRLSTRKIAGTAALQAIAEETVMLNGPSMLLLKMILLKDLRAGFGASTINKAKAGTIPEFPYMRCSLPASSNMAKWDFSKGIISQEKADGMYASCDVFFDGSVRLLSRQGTEYPLVLMGDLGNALSMSLNASTQTHGELLAYQDGKLLPREESNGILNSVSNGGALESNQHIEYHVWDQIPLDDAVPKGKCEVPYGLRLRILKDQIPTSPESLLKLVPTKVVRSKAEAMDHYRSFIRAGKEGTILKAPTAIWKDGTSKDQVKMKMEVCVELRVVGWNAGTGKYAGQLGSLKCESECGTLKVDVTGRGDAMRAEVLEKWAEWDRSVVTVKFNSIMESTDPATPHSLFLPIFMERRQDKTVADTFEQIKAQFAAAVEAV